MLLVDDTMTAPYKAFMVIHVLMAILWVGGGAMVTFQANKAIRAKNDDDMIASVVSAEFWAKRLFIPGSIVLLICGMGMIGTGHLGFAKPFIDIGLTGWVITFVTGAAYLGPQSGKTMALYETAGRTVTEDVKAKVLRVVRVARVDVAMLLIVACFMVVQPWGAV